MQTPEAHAGLPSPPPPPFEGIDVVWHYGVGDPDEGPNPSLSLKPALNQGVRLPHLVLLPDTPLWYETVIDAAEPAILKIIGDDGVQVFVNGGRVRSFEGILFPLPAGREQTLTIRVVNNAQHGGLSSVARASSDCYTAWETRQNLRRRLDHVVRKLAALPARDRAVLDAIVLAAVQEPSEASLTEAEKALTPWPSLRIAPFLQNPAAGRMTIRWESDTTGAAVLDWSLDHAGPGIWRYSQRVAGNDGLFETTLTGLPSGRKVFYRVRQDETTSAPYEFTTPAADGGEFQFTVWGDSQTGWGTLRRLLGLMEADPPAFTVGVGDLVNAGFQPDHWRGFFAAIQPLASRVPFMLMPGNHDYDGYYDDFEATLFRRYARRPGQPNYLAWTWGCARFVALDPNDTFPISIPPGSAQHAWLMRELASEAWRKAVWRFVFVHQPCRSQGKPDGYEGDRRIRDLLDPLAEQAGIDFIISGHTHDYERLRIEHPGGGCTHHLIVGGAGAPLTSPHDYPSPFAMDALIREHHFGRFHVSPCRVEFEVIDLEGRRRDHFAAAR